MRKLIVACAGLAALSLLLPSELSYDPWAWLIWGREIAHLRLDTAGGPSWKPLPVLVTTAVAPLGELDRGLPPALWVALARAGALLALALAFRLAAQLAGGGRAGAVGGAVAALVLFLTPDWFQFAAQGSEAPLAVALMLWAIERHLDGRVDHARGARDAHLSDAARRRSRSWRRTAPGRGCRGRACGRWWRARCSCCRSRGSSRSGSARGARSTAAHRRVASPPGASRTPSTRGCVRFERVHNHVGLPVELVALVAVTAAAARRCAIVVALAGAALRRGRALRGDDRVRLLGQPALRAAGADALRRPRGRRRRPAARRRAASSGARHGGARAGRRPVRCGPCRSHGERVTRGRRAHAGCTATWPGPCASSEARTRSRHWARRPPTGPYIPASHGSSAHRSSGSSA